MLHDVFQVVVLHHLLQHAQLHALVLVHQHVHRSAVYPLFLHPHLALLVLLDQLVLLDHKVQTVHLDPQDLQDHQVYQVHLDHQVCLNHHLFHVLKCAIQFAHQLVQITAVQVLRHHLHHHAHQYVQ